MAIPDDTKDRAIYHLILAEMHRLHGLMLNMRTVEPDETAQALREHLSREQNLVLGKLTQWKERRPAIYGQAQKDFQGQVRRD
jgi:hypothetical protein